MSWQTDCSALVSVYNTVFVNISATYCSGLVTVNCCQYDCQITQLDRQKLAVLGIRMFNNEEANYLRLIKRFRADGKFIIYTDQILRIRIKKTCSDASNDGLLRNTKFSLKLPPYYPNLNPIELV